MRIIAGFRFGPVHVPLRRRAWCQRLNISVPSKGTNYDLVVLCPLTEATHEMEGIPAGRVADAYIGLLVECESPKSSNDFKTIAEVVVASVSPLIEELRVMTQQPHLKLRHISDLMPGEIISTDGSELPELTAKFKEWMESEAGGRPLPYLTRENWDTVIGKREKPATAGNAKVEGIPLYESLLLDAELALESDPRIGILFSALACEVFIQNLLEKRAAKDLRLRCWLIWADPRNGPEKAASVRTYFDLGLILAGCKSLKEVKSLWKAFSNLINARNEVSHRGSLPNSFTPADAVITARHVISWVKALGDSE